MFGARQDHVLVTGNLYSALKLRLRGGPCRTYVSDMRLRVAAADVFFIPMSWSPAMHAIMPLSFFFEYPRLLIEVLSPGTSAFDRGHKASAYRLPPSLREYGLVEIDARRLEFFRRTDQADWLLHDCHRKQTACLFECLDLELGMAEIFEDVPARE